MRPSVAGEQTEETCPEFYLLVTSSIQIAASFGFVAVGSLDRWIVEFEC